MALEIDTTNAEDFVLHILMEADESQWTTPVGEPDRIAPVVDYTPNEKANYERDAIYCYLNGQATVTPMDGSGDAKEERVEVVVDPWLYGDSVDYEDEFSRDIIEIVNQYWTENKNETEWVTVRTVRYEVRPGPIAMHSEMHGGELVAVELMRDSSV